jgi:uncharacterized membrane protein YeaQ/YmgE (transglycosylase-associated protein family)
VVERRLNRNGINRSPTALLWVRQRSTKRDDGEKDQTMNIGSLLAALALGFVAGVIGRAVVPGDAFRSFSGWQSWLMSTMLGLIGSLVGYWIFTGLFGIGDDDKFDWGGIIGAIIGAIIVVAVGSWLFRKIAKRDVV